MFERFTQQARSSVAAAQEAARSLQAAQLLPVHILLGAVTVAEESQSPLAVILAETGLTSAVLHTELQALGSATALGEQDAEALQSIGIDLDSVRRAVEEQFGPGALDADAPPSARRSLFGRRKGGAIPFSRSAKSVLESSLREASARRDGYIGTEHIVLGVIRGGDPTARALISGHTDPAALAARIRNTMDQAA